MSGDKKSTRGAYSFPRLSAGGKKLDNPKGESREIFKKYEGRRFFSASLSKSHAGYLRGDEAMGAHPLVEGLTNLGISCSQITL